MKKNILFVVVLFLTGIFIFKTYTSSTPQTSEEVYIPSVRTIPVTLTSVQETVDFSGFIQGADYVSIAPHIAGSIIKLTKEEGDTVLQGEVLAVLDGRELTTNTENTLDSLRSLEKTIKETKKYYDQKVEEAKTAFENTVGTQEKSSSEEAWKSAKRFRDAQIATLENQRTALSGSLILAETNESYTLLKAPFSGVITEKRLSIGSYVAPGTTLYVLSSSKKLEIKISLPFSLTRKIAKNSKVLIRDESNTTIEGFVFSISASLPENGEQSIARIHFPPQTDTSKWYLGKYVQVSFLVGAEHKAMLVPEQAIISQYDNTFLYTVEGNQIKKHTVLLGKTYNGKKEILSEIPSSQHIVIEGGYLLSPDQRVTEIYETK